MHSTRRQQILDAAARLLLHYGPSKTTVSDIAREARVGVGSVYLEFESKDAIVAALSRGRHERVLEAVGRALGERGSCAERLERALTARFEAFGGCARESAHGPDLFHCACPAIEEAHHAFREAELELFARFLDEARRELVIEDARADAQALLRAYAAFSPPLVFQLSMELLREDLPRVHRIVLRGLVLR
ncbi:MAG: TetR/AcrR family transcriptional regulator [Sandaracinaceae bacterium]|nr:TetR/AcrR family transcriptional regulator [Sandaracinaceae bacterium]